MYMMKMHFYYTILVYIKLNN